MYTPLLSTRRAVESMPSAILLSDLVNRLSDAYIQPKYGPFVLTNNGTLIVPGGKIETTFTSHNGSKDITEQLRAGISEKTCSVVSYMSSHNDVIRHIVVPHTTSENQDDIILSNQRTSRAIGRLGTDLFKVMNEVRRPNFGSMHSVSNVQYGHEIGYPEHGVLIETKPLSLCSVGLHCTDTHNLGEWLVYPKQIVEQVRISGSLQLSTDKINSQIMEFGFQETRYDGSKALLFSDFIPFRINEELWRAFIREEMAAFAESFGRSYDLVELIGPTLISRLMYEQSTWLPTFFFRVRNVRQSYDTEGGVYLYRLVLEQIRDAYKASNQYQQQQFFIKLTGSTRFMETSPSFDELLKATDAIVKEKLAEQNA